MGERDGGKYEQRVLGGKYEQRVLEERGRENRE